MSLYEHTADAFLSMTDASANTRICLRFLAAASGHHRIFGVRSYGRQLKIDAPLSPTIFLPISCSNLLPGTPVCSVGVTLTIYRENGDSAARNRAAIFFCNIVIETSDELFA